MRIRDDTRQLLAALFGGPHQLPRFRVQPHHDRLVVETRQIAQPLTLFRCPSHSNHVLARLVGLIWRDTDGAMRTEEVRRVAFPRH